MKTKKQITTEILRVKQKIENAKISGKGYSTFSDLRRDETKIKVLEWVLEDE